MQVRESHTGRQGGLQQAGEGGKRWGSEGEGEGEEGEGDGSLSWCGGFLLLCRQDHTLMGALSRVLGDEYRKSMELTYNIMRIFLAFSNFVEVPTDRQTDRPPSTDTTTTCSTFAQALRSCPQYDGSSYSRGT